MYAALEKLGTLGRFFIFLIDIVKCRSTIRELAKSDFKHKYLGSYLGIVWAFAQPVITILIFWFVFEVGFKASPVKDYPFILWLSTGMIPWFFISESIMNATNSIMEQNFLVNKVVFRVSILPLVKILSALYVHIFFVFFLIFIFVLYGYNPDIYALQVFYYAFASIVLITGLSWLTSSIVIFVKDLFQIVIIVLQFGFWMTPIFWSINMIPESYQRWIRLNPVYYIVHGYRNAFIYKRWFWEEADLTIIFWSTAAVAFILGALIFRRLRPHFADVV